MTNSNTHKVASFFFLNEMSYSRGIDRERGLRDSRPRYDDYPSKSSSSHYKRDRDYDGGRDRDRDYRRDYDRDGYRSREPSRYDNRDSRTSHSSRDHGYDRDRRSGSHRSGGEYQSRRPTQDFKRPRIEQAPAPEMESSPEPEDGVVVRKTLWGSEKKKSNIPGLPTSLPSDLANEQIEHYIIHLRIEEINRSLRMGTYLPRHKRSVSPEPTYGPDGRRNNTRDMRYRNKLEEEQHSLVEYGMKHIIGFRAPIDYKRAQQVQEKVFIPQDEYPDINFIGLLIGPRGNTLKKMESETGTKISIRGRGSVKEGKIKSSVAAQEGSDEDLHALVCGDSDDRVKACITMILKVIETAAHVPEGQNELKRQQLLELAKLNGTLREDESQICTNCGGTGNFNLKKVTNVTNVQKSKTLLPLLFAVFATVLDTWPKVFLF